MKRMQLTGIALLLMTGIPVISMAQNKVEADIGADLVSGYIWRGQDLGNVSMQRSASVSYKGFSLYFLIDTRVGGDVISLTQAGLDYAGVSKATGDARNAGHYMLEGHKISDVQKFYQMVGDRGNGTTEFYRYDGTNIRLREVSLGYSFPQRMLEKTGFIKGVDLSLVARNLFFIYKDAPFDPDATMSVGNDNQGLDTFGMPSTRNIGFNIKFTF